MRYPFQTPDGYEEKLNQQVIAHLYYSLQQGPTLLNRAFENTPVEFSDGAEIVAHQYDPLPRQADTETNREIDWVIRDDDKLVGFESKYGASLGTKQLQDELAKLRANADGREVHLIAITRTANAPSLIANFESEPVYWTSWFTISKEMERANREQIPAEQRASLQMLQDLFEVENMEPFRGFDHKDKQQYKYFIRDLRPEVNEIDLENRGNIHTWTDESPQPSGGSRISPKYIAIPFVDKNRPDHYEEGRPRSKRASYLLVIVDTELQKVYAGVVFDIQKISKHRKMLIEKGDAIADECHSQGFEMWIGRHSLNNWEVPPEKTQDIVEMKMWLSKTGKKVLAHHDEDDNYRKVWFVKECTNSDPETLFSSVIKGLSEQQKRFLDRNDFVECSTLVDPDSV